VKVFKGFRFEPQLYAEFVCVNLISELLEHQEEVKEKDHAC